MASPIIELKNVGFSFDDAPLFKDVNLSLCQGETLVIIGPSGQGKTILLKILCGLVEPTTGEVYYNGKSLLTLRSIEKENLLRTFGVLFQKNALFDSMTSGENIAFPLRETTSKSHKEIDTIVDKYLDSVGLAQAKDLFPDEISGGMQKRLGIARALALEPKVVFYDDPTAGLDPITSRNIVSLILRLKKDFNSTIVAITNDMNRAYQMADNIAIVLQGEVILTGTPEQTQKHNDPRVKQFINGLVSGPLTQEENDQVL